MKIYLDANQRLRTCRNVLREGGFLVFEGKADPGDYIVRYGCNYGSSRGGGWYPNGTSVLNPKIILNKLEALKLWATAGVLVPDSWDSKEEWKAFGEPTKILRKKYYSAGGFGIKLLGSPKDMDFNNGRYYYQEFIDKEREFRLFQVWDKIVFLMEKPKVNGVVWNLAQNPDCRWSGYEGTPELKEEIRKVGFEALKAINYDFAAIDLMLKGGQLYVLEANSRPTLGPNNTVRVAEAFTSYAKGGGRNE